MYGQVLATHYWWSVLELDCDAGMARVVEMAVIEGFILNEASVEIVDRQQDFIQR